VIDSSLGPSAGVNVRIRLSVLASLVAMTTLAGQEGQPPRDPQATPPVFRSSTNVIRVDMYATKNGALVTDLQPDEVEVLEDGVKQKIETFEYVHLNADTTAVVPGQNPNDRARVFIIFVDTFTTRFAGQSELRRSLLRLLDRLLLPNDLVGLMTSEMSASDVVLGRRSTVISDLANDSRWVQRTLGEHADAKEYAWENCYGNTDPRLAEMKRRRRARVTLEALQDLSSYLVGLREERKAVLLLTGGWYFQEEIQTQESRAREEELDRQRIGETSSCNADWRALQRVDFDRLVTQLGRGANRANVTFYPVNFQSVGVKRGRFASRVQTGFENQLQRLAETTDGLAEIGGRDLEQVTDRIIRDTSSYYLLSYQVANAHTDSVYHPITVRVKRSGVTVRARAGYGGEPVRVAKETAPTRPPIDSRIATAFDGVQRFEALSPVWVRTSSFAMSTASGSGGAFWVIGEPGANTQAFKNSTAEIIVTTPDRRQVFTGTLNLRNDAFTVRVPESGTLPFGSYSVRVRIRPVSESGSPLVQDLPRVELTASTAGLGEPILWRRGPLVRDMYEQSADPRFHRNERLRLEYATDVAGEPAAKMIDRAGQPLQVPVQLTDRPGAEGSGMHWIVADLPLAAFAPGEYAVSLSQGDKTQVTAFRIVP
jgi:VWFA-related protein